ncbi:unnamed protein product [Cyprideis torosa]|uniref:Uncharacterized protein n=1 Tax=Cyprideis torosa TaxID=163714 RepID=A0A7R8ZI24_9CRUS|nr:unnamed protein product [Cyprideis torosa]CAG0883821.1 unnamed protein product [Cyprideis torosa]
MNRVSTSLLKADDAVFTFASLPTVVEVKPLRTFHHDTELVPFAKTPWGERFASTNPIWLYPKNNISRKSTNNSTNDLTKPYEPSFGLKIPRRIAKSNPTLSSPRNKKPESLQIRNIMHDPRVYRGTTITSQKPKLSQEGPMRANSSFPKLQERSRKRRYKRQGTPPPIRGRDHVSIQTEKYLEELTDREIEADTSVQTEEPLNDEMTPQNEEKPETSERETQVDEEDLLESEDWDFEPLISMLVGKALEAGLKEASEEEEAIVSKRVGMKIREWRLAREDAIVAALAPGVLDPDDEYLAAAALAADDFNNMSAAVFRNLADSGYLQSSEQSDIGLIPWLTDQMTVVLERNHIEKDIINELVFEISRRRHEALRRAKDEIDRLEEAEDDQCSESLQAVNTSAGKRRLLERLASLEAARS